MKHTPFRGCGVWEREGGGAKERGGEKRGEEINGEERRQDKKRGDERRGEVIEER